MTEEFQEAPIELNIKNWPAAWAKSRFVKHTTLKTYIIDATGATGPKYAQIAAFEPDRVRMTIQALTSAVAVCTEVPVTSPDGVVAAIPPTGKYLPASLVYEYTFYGPDAFWVNSLADGVTMVTVTKEYC